MSAATLAVLARGEAVITDPDCVAKSFPGFWRQLEAAGVRLSPAADPASSGPPRPGVGR